VLAEVLAKVSEVSEIEISGLAKLKILRLGYQRTNKKGSGLLAIKELRKN
jgi:hypothetical protein